MQRKIMTKTTQVRKSKVAVPDSGRERIEVGAANVFEDLGFADADDLNAKVLLAVEINKILAAKGWKQTYVARLFGIAQPHVSDLRNFKLRHFSTDRLMGFLCRLNVDVEIVMKARGTVVDGVGTLSVKRLRA